MATDLSTTRDASADLVRIGVAHTVVVAVPVLVVSLVLVPWWLAVVVAVVVGVAVTGWRARRVDDRVRSSLGARPVDAREVPRLAGVVESVAMGTGVTPPRLHVVDDPARNAVVWCSGWDDVSIAVTTGMLDAAERIELEAVVAHLLAVVRDGVVEAPSVVAALFDRFAGGPLGSLVASLARAGTDERRVILADLEGTRITRYPPGAVAALERVRAGSSVVSRSPRSLQPLWFAAPTEAPLGDPFAVHPPLADRIDLLREL